MLSLPEFVIALRRFQARGDQRNIFLGCLDTALGFLLKAVQYVNPSRKLDCVYGSVGVAAMVFNHLQYACRAKPAHCLSVLVFASSLCQINSVPEDVFNLLWHCIQIALGGAHPFEGFSSLSRHFINYVY